MSKFTIAIFLSFLTLKAFSQEVWTVRPSGTFEDFTSAGFANGRFMAAHFDFLGGGLVTSADGKSWSAVEWARGKIYRVWAGTDEFLAHDAEGALWRITDKGGEKIPTDRYGSFAEFAAERNGVWVIGGGFDWAAGVFPPILRYAAGVLRPAALAPFSSAPDWVVAGPDGFLAGAEGAIYASGDGDHWTLRSRPERSITRPVLKGNVLYASGVQSTDGGVTWREIDPDPWAPSPALYAAGTFLSLSDGLLTSSDFVKWTRREPGTTDTLRAAAYGNGVFVVVGEGGRIVTSPSVAEPATVSPVAATITPSVTIKWRSKPGGTYRVESSADMKEWRGESDWIPGTGAEMSRSFDITGDRKFFRVFEKED